MRPEINQREMRANIGLICMRANMNIGFEMRGCTEGRKDEMPVLQCSNFKIMRTDTICHTLMMDSRCSILQEYTSFRPVGWTAVPRRARLRLVRQTSRLGIVSHHIHPAALNQVIILANKPTTTHPQLPQHFRSHQSIHLSLLT
jgi:hypothetical protein